MMTHLVMDGTETCLHSGLLLIVMVMVLWNTQNTFLQHLEAGSMMDKNTFPGLGDVFGCTDPTATNYDATATVDDGSCIPSIISNLSALDPESRVFDTRAGILLLLLVRRHQLRCW